MKDDAKLWSQEEWGNHWQRLVDWLCNLLQSQTNVPNEAQPLVHGLFNLLDELRDLIDGGNLRRACELLRIVEWKMLILCHLFL